jgi:hypothetical protein
MHKATFICTAISSLESNVWFKAQSDLAGIYKRRNSGKW